MSRSEKCPVVYKRFTAVGQWQMRKMGFAPVVTGSRICEALASRDLEGNNFQKDCARCGSGVEGYRISAPERGTGV